jgi:hypothetical protein
LLTSFITIIYPCKGGWVICFPFCIIWFCQHTVFIDEALCLMNKPISLYFFTLLLSEVYLVDLLYLWRESSWGRLLRSWGFLSFNTDMSLCLILGLCSCWCLFRAPITKQEPRRCSLHRSGRSAARGRTVSDLAQGLGFPAWWPDGPHVCRGDEGRRRRIDLAPGRDPVGEERS